MHTCAKVCMQLDRHVLHFILFPFISCFKRKHLSISVCLTPARPVPVEHMLSQHLAQVCSSDGNGHLSASDHPEPIRLDADMSTSCGRWFLQCTFNCAGNHTWTFLCSSAFKRVRLVIRADGRCWLSSETGSTLASVNKYAYLLEACSLESTFAKQ